MIKVANILILLTLLTNVACAEEATSPVKSSKSEVEGQNGPNDDHADDEDHLELMALTYKGKDPFGTDCFLHISGVEEEHDGEHHHELVAKLGYSIHGQIPMDTVVSLQRYNLDTNTYYSADSNEAGTVPVFVSAVLKDENIVVDYNKLLEYEQTGVLVQSLRADLNNVDLETFESTLDEVLEDNASFEMNKDVLNQLQSTVLKVSHGGHFDAAACSKFNLTGMNLVEFELDGEHGDHDDDHGDDHDDDDDHDGHDHD